MLYKAFKCLYFIPWYICIPKECFSPLKHSTSAWASRTRGRSRARSTTDQKPDQDQKLVAFKKLRFSQLLSVSKSCGALALITRTAPATVPITPMNISLQGMYGCAVPSPESKSGLDSDEGGPSIPFHPRSSIEATGDVIEVVWCAGTASPSQCSKWPNNDRREALGHSIAHHRSYGATALQDASPLGSGSFPRFSLCWLTASRRPSV